MKNIRLFIVEDHELLREGLRFFLSGIPFVDVLGIAATPAEAFQLIARCSPDVLLVDLGLPSIEVGFGFIEDVASRYPRVKILVLTSFDDPDAVRGALAAGANGYVLKSASMNELSSAITQVYEGKVYLSPDVATSVVHGYLHPGNNGDSPAKNLSRREKEVLRLVTEGRGNKEIGEMLFISHRTVEKHKGSLKRKLHCGSSVELAVYCVKNGIC